MKVSQERASPWTIGKMVKQKETIPRLASLRAKCLWYSCGHYDMCGDHSIAN